MVLLLLAAGQPSATITATGTSLLALVQLDA